MGDLSLVTGATGFIGSHLVRQLLEREERVRVLVRTPERLDDVGLGGARGAGLEVRRGDLLEPATVTAALEGVRCVYHVAGFVSTKRRDRDAVYRLNCDTTEILFDAIRRSGVVERTVYLASIFALGGSVDGRPVAEDAEWSLGGLGVDYVDAKRRAELFALRCRDEGMPLVFVYPCFCYGPGDVYGSSSKVIDLHLDGLLLAAFAGGQNAMDVRDAAAGLRRGMCAGRLGERYIVGGVNLTYAEIGERLSAITGRRPPVVSLPPALGRLAGRVAEGLLRRPPIDEGAVRLASRCWYYDDSKARRELGHVSRPIEEAFRDAVAWQEERRRHDGWRRHRG